MSNGRRCKKCNQQMHGPKWNESDNRLYWSCSCGFRDSTESADNAWTKADLLRMISAKYGEKRAGTPHGGTTP